MIRHVEEHGSGAETQRGPKQLLSAVCVGGNKRPNLIGADTLAPHHETGI